MPSEEMPEEIGLVHHVILGFRLWNREQDHDESTAIRYVRADVVQRRIDEAKAERTEQCAVIALAAVLTAFQGAMACHGEITKLEAQAEADDAAAEIRSLTQKDTPHNAE